MKIQNILMPDLVLSEVNAEDRDGVLGEIVGFLKDRNRIPSEKELFDKLIQREELGSTAIGSGVAIPHCKMKGIKNPIIALALSKRGVDFFALDKKPTQIFFVVISSPENPSLNLQILAAIAHLVRKGKNLKKKILDADSIPGILHVLREEEDRLHE